MPRLLLNYSFLPQNTTGLGVYAENIIPAFADFDYSIATPRLFRSDLKNPVISPAGITSEKGSMAHLKRLAWTEGKLPLMRRDKSDIVFSPVPEVPLLSCRKVMVVHDLIPLKVDDTSWNLRQYFTHYVLRAIRNADLVITDSECTKRDIEELAHISTDRIRVVPLGVDIDRFAPQRHVVKKPYLLYVGRQDRYKNISKAITAFSRLENSGLAFWIVGPEHATETPRLRQLCVDLHIADRVIFLNYVSNRQLVQLMQEATVLIHLSAYEGFGLTVLEAMAAGTAVVCSNAEALNEIVGNAASVCDPSDESLIASTILRVVSDLSWRQLLETRGRSHVRRFSWQHCTTQVAAAVRDFTR